MKKTNRRVKLAIGSRRARFRFAWMAFERFHERIYRGFISSLTRGEPTGSSGIPQLKTLERSLGVRNQFVPQGGFWFGVKSDPSIDDWSNSVKVLLTKDKNASISVR